MSSESLFSEDPSVQDPSAQEPSVEPSQDSAAVRTGSRRPAVEPADAARWAQEIYGLKAEPRELAGDSDRNFLLTPDDQDAGDRWVLKVAGPWVDRQTLEFQNAAMSHLAGTEGLPVAKLRSGLSGDTIAERPDGEGRSCQIRLVSFLEGQVWADARPQTLDLRSRIGELLGRVDRGLADFNHPAMEKKSSWDLSQGGQVVAQHRDKISAQRQNLLDAVLERWRDHVSPRLEGLRRAVIHNDGNDYNVLLRLADDDRLEPSGVIDFGDAMYTHAIHGPAIAAAYAGLGQEDPLRAAASLVAGYHSAHPLTEPELELVFDLMRTRLAVSVSMAAYQRDLEPDNEYLSISEASAWQSLALLNDVDPELAHCTFRVACGLPASPKQVRVVPWLQARRGSFGKVMDGDLATAPVLDLSPAGPMAARLAQAGEPGACHLLSEHVRRLIEGGADLVLGRFNEPRLVYAAEQFDSVKGLEHPERRTIHLGVDLFQAPGSPVYAPLDGTIHSFADNNLPLDYGPTLILKHQIPSSEASAENGETFFTLYGHLDRGSLEGKRVGAEVRAGEVIGHLGDASVNGGWAPHLHFQLLLETFGRQGEFPGVAAPSDRRMWTELCPDPDLILNVPEEVWPPAATGAQEILDRRRRSLGRNLSISYGRHLHIVAGRGTYLYDAEGRAYLDAVNNVPHVGHCHPRVVAAGQNQMAVLNTNTRYLHAGLMDYAERLLSYFPEALDVCIFCCTGSEANDLALRMAQAHTGGDHILVVDGAYHGHTHRLIGLSPYKFDGPGGAGAAGDTRVIPLPCGYRGPHKHGEPDLGARYAEPVREAWQSIAEEGGKASTFICESVLGCGGQVVLPEGYLQAAYAHTRAAGGVCMADEVQVGFGRVGSHMWAFETQGVVPDIVTLGKPIGNGHPMSAVIVRSEIADSFANGMEYFNTFGGNAVSCAIGQAVLDVIEDEDLRGNAARVGGYLLQGLRELMPRHSIIGEVRGLGLFIGVELVRDSETLEPAAAEASYIAERMRDHGILISTDGPLHNVLKMKPPLVFSENEAKRLIQTLDQVLCEDRVRRVSGNR